MMSSNYIGDNINAIRIEAGLSQVELAKAAHTSQTTLSSWECGRSIPRQSNIERLIKALPHLNLTADDILSDEAGFAKRSLRQASAATSHTVPLYGSISAGQPLEMLPVQEYADVPASVAHRYPNAFFLKVNGESMNRCIPNGCLALINPVKALDASCDGYVFALCVNGSDATLKRVHLLHNGVELLPDSTDPTFEPYIIDFRKTDETLRVIGEVVWFCSPLDFRL